MRVDNQPVATQQRKTVDIVHILDKSGSMDNANKLKIALQGINAEIKELKKDTEIDYFFTLVLFGSMVERTIWRKPIKQVNVIDTYTSGMTALYQAIGETLESFPNENPVLVKIFTDGEENQSRGKYATADSVRALLKELDEKDFTITFVGTEKDVRQIQSVLGIAEGNTLVHNNTAESVKMSFTKSFAATRSYTEAVKEGTFTKTMSFYNQD